MSKLGNEICWIQDMTSLIQLLLSAEVYDRKTISTSKIINLAKGKIKGQDDSTIRRRLTEYIKENEKQSNQVLSYHIIFFLMITRLHSYNTKKKKNSNSNHSKPSKPLDIENINSGEFKEYYSFFSEIRNSEEILENFLEIKHFKDLIKTNKVFEFYDGYNEKNILTYLTEKMFGFKFYHKLYLLYKSCEKSYSSNITYKIVVAASYLIGINDPVLRCVLLDNFLKILNSFRGLYLEKLDSTRIFKELNKKYIEVFSYQPFSNEIEEILDEANAKIEKIVRENTKADINEFEIIHIHKYIPLLINEINETSEQFECISVIRFFHHLRHKILIKASEFEVVKFKDLGNKELKKDFLNSINKHMIDMYDIVYISEPLLTEMLNKIIECYKCTKDSDSVSIDTNIIYSLSLFTHEPDFYEIMNIFSGYKGQLKNVISAFKLNKNMYDAVVLNYPLSNYYTINISQDEASLKLKKEVEKDKSNCKEMIFRIILDKDLGINIRQVFFDSLTKKNEALRFRREDFKKIITLSFKSIYHELDSEVGKHYFDFYDFIKNINFLLSYEEKNKTYKEFDFKDSNKNEYFIAKSDRVNEELKEYFNYLEEYPTVDEFAKIFDRIEGDFLVEAKGEQNFFDVFVRLPKLFEYVSNMVNY